tara:strand:- start:124 stop:774 length:651 start_codon:yes stop_codon:yes gene_type:complete
MSLSTDALLKNIRTFVQGTMAIVSENTGSHGSLIAQVQQRGEEFLALTPALQRRAESPAPVREWLGQALSEATKRECDGSTARILESLSIMADDLPWEVGYEGAGITDHFRRNFGYATLVGPGALIESDRFSAGVTMFGPDMFYDWHHHPAHEFYLNLTEGSGWGLDFEALSTRAFGEVIVHPGGRPHAMRSFDQPLLAPWLWCGDVHEPAKMTAQ